MPETKACTSELLAQIQVFDKFEEHQRANIAQLAIIKEYQEGEFVAHQGDIWPYVLLLIEGVVNVHKLSLEGRSLGAWRLSSGEIFWSPSLFDQGQLPASLEVRESCVAYLWHADQILPVIQNHQKAMWELCIVLVRRMRQASSMVEDLAFHPVASRVARLLIKQYREIADDHITRSLTLDEMATMIGTTPVMVCKVLSSFASDELIKLSRTEFEFIDIEKLIEIAGM